MGLSIKREKECCIPLLRPLPKHARTHAIIRMEHFQSSPNLKSNIFVISNDSPEREKMARIEDRLFSIFDSIVNRPSLCRIRQFDTCAGMLSGNHMNIACLSCETNDPTIKDNDGFTSVCLRFNSIEDDVVWTPEFPACHFCPDPFYSSGAADDEKIDYVVSFPVCRDLPYSYHFPARLNMCCVCVESTEFTYCQECTVGGRISEDQRNSRTLAGFHFRRAGRGSNVSIQLSVTAINFDGPRTIESSDGPDDDGDRIVHKMDHLRRRVPVEPPTYQDEPPMPPIPEVITARRSGGGARKRTTRPFSGEEEPPQKKSVFYCDE